MNNMLRLFFSLSLITFISCDNTKNANSSENTPINSITKQFSIEIIDSAAIAIIPADANFEVLAQGFSWSEGPVWVDNLNTLLFSDVPKNKVYKWDKKNGLGVYLESAGHAGQTNKDSNKGPNGLLLDHDNRLIICQHGERRIALLDTDLKNPENKFIALADTYQGKRFNSPNDLAIDSAGNIYFTDPPYGQTNNKTGEIGINGVFMVHPDHRISLLIDSLTMPNGIALSLNRKWLYINQSDPKNPVLYKYEIAPNKSLRNGKVLFDFLELAKKYKGMPDGLKVHKSGNIFTTGPGGVHILSPEGKQLALIRTPKATSNCAFDTEQKYLYMTTSDLLTRVKLK